MCKFRTKLHTKYLIIWCSILLMLVGCETTQPPTKPPTTVTNPTNIPYKKPKIALALGGGAARGFAHIGVIKVLEAHGIVPDIIVGTSAGSVVGSLYAGGYSGFELQKIGLQLDEALITDWSLSTKGLVLRGESLQNYINKTLGQRPIEKLPKKLGIVATQLQTGKMIVFQTGNTGMAVRASSSVPGVFQATNISGQDYVDGGLTSPVPVAAAKLMGADKIIAVDISSQPEFGSTLGTIDILLQTFSIMGKSISQYELTQADVVIRPELGHIKGTDFQSRNLSILEGERATQAQLPAILKWLER
jgi:NTE family protein